MNVREFLEKFPKYRSHYSAKRSDKKYLPMGLNLRILHKLYIEFCTEKEVNHISAALFNRIFRDDYNLSFKPIRQDVCNLCTQLKISLSSTVITTEKRIELMERNEDHKRLIAETYKNYKADVQRTNENGIICLTFDLQRTLECPSLNASSAYYKRKLWIYNLCIYDEGKRKGSMYTWDESIASRGAQEIASCLIYHLKHYEGIDCVTKIILYSDACGGQNRNIFLTIMLKHLLEADLQHVESIEHKFFVSGHSYNSCDRCFGMIERNRKSVENVYLPSDWYDIIRGAKKNNTAAFSLKEMKREDFLSCKELSKLIINRKKNSHWS